MKSEKIDGDRRLSYPKLMVNRDDTLVVLFSKDKLGTIVYTSGKYKVGYWSEDWSMVNFSDYVGTIELVN